MTSCYIEKYLTLNVPYYITFKTILTDLMETSQNLIKDSNLSKESQGSLPNPEFLPEPGTFKAKQC